MPGKTVDPDQTAPEGSVVFAIPPDLFETSLNGKMNGKMTKKIKDTFDNWLM